MTRPNPVGAYTGPTPPRGYPGYVCIEKTGVGVRITVRSSPDTNGREGGTASVLIPDLEFARILVDLEK